MKTNNFAHTINEQIRQKIGGLFYSETNNEYDNDMCHYSFTG